MADFEIKLRDHLANYSRVLGFWRDSSHSDDGGFVADCFSFSLTILVAEIETKFGLNLLYPGGHFLDSAFNLRTAEQRTESVPQVLGTLGDALQKWEENFTNQRPDASFEYVSTTIMFYNVVLIFAIGLCMSRRPGETMLQLSIGRVLTQLDQVDPSQCPEGAQALVDANFPRLFATPLIISDAPFPLGQAISQFER